MTYVRFGALPELPALVARLGARTVVLDIEPLISRWDDSQDALDDGVRGAVALFAAVPGLRVLCFSTNSARAPTSTPQLAGLQVRYLVSARKPGSTAPYQSWPLPGVVAGDQILTDGVLARRLGYTFLHFRQRLRDVPLGPRLLAGSGELLRPLLFADRAGRD